MQNVQNSKIFSFENHQGCVFDFLSDDLNVRLVTVYLTRGGLAPQILVGFFFEGPPKNAAKTKMLTKKKKKIGH
jgi:hypothetical protein